jgi:hypothetical protein
VTGLLDGADSVTATSPPEEPSFPSTTVAVAGCPVVSGPPPETDRSGAASSSRIVAAPVAFTITALVGSERVTVNVSSSSSRTSPPTDTEIVWVAVEPVKTSTPLRGV